MPPVARIFPSVAKPQPNWVSISRTRFGGLAYGIGFGAGIEYALYFYQRTVRAKLEEVGPDSAGL